MFVGSRPVSAPAAARDHPRQRAALTLGEFMCCIQNGNKDSRFVVKRLPA
jgi:hypothetical protein